MEKIKGMERFKYAPKRIGREWQTFLSLYRKNFEACYGEFQSEVRTAYVSQYISIQQYQQYLEIENYFDI